MKPAIGVSIGAALLLVGAGLGFGLRTATGGTPAPPPASIGDQMDRAVPISLLRLQFTDELGKAVSLSNFVGRAVFLVPFLTSCQEECPVTTGALLAIKRALLAAHLQRKVALVEVTVDPRRDQPERLSAYARLTGVSWHLLTGSSGDLENLWRFFGIYSQAVPEGAPPGIDWQTAKPYTYDVDHSDGFIVLDPKLRERFVAAGMVRGARLSPELRRLLDSQGLRNLNHPGGGSWSIAQALDAISWVLGGS